MFAIIVLRNKGSIRRIIISITKTIAKLRSENLDVLKAMQRREGGVVSNELSKFVDDLRRKRKVKNKAAEGGSD